MGAVCGAGIIRRKAVHVVYDLVNAGPQHRFTVRTEDGRSILVSNCCLGAESCILRVALRECEENGYPIVYHCYDEAVAELPRGVGSVEEMAGLMLRLPEWTAGLPLGAAGFRSKRYKKA